MKTKPLMYPTPQDLQDKIDDYFEKTEGKHVTWTGLCLHLNTTKKTLIEYQQREGYQKIVTMAKMKVENEYEKSLREHGRSGDIFALKNFGWTDKQEIEHSGGIKSYNYDGMTEEEAKKAFKEMSND